MKHRVNTNDPTTTDGWTTRGTPLETDKKRLNRSFGTQNMTRNLI